MAHLILDVHIVYHSFKKVKKKNCQGHVIQGKTETIGDGRRLGKQRQGGNPNQILNGRKGPFVFIKEKLVKFEEFIVLLIILSQC